MSEHASTTHTHADPMMELTAQIIAAYVSRNEIPSESLPSLIREVHSSLSQTQAPEPDTKAFVIRPEFAIPKSELLQHDELTCAICGFKGQMLKRHLMTEHEMTPSEYRRKCDLPPDFPMVAPGYSEIRSRLALSQGLGVRKSKPFIARHV